MAKLPWILSISLALIVACSDDKSSSAKDEESREETEEKPNNPGSSSSKPSSSAADSLETALQNIDGMVLVKVNSDPIPVGTDKSGAKPSETPKMGVILDYKFLMDVHEVTCKEYGASCSNENHPVANVTYYDAILYANKKSVKMGYDTVYSYLSRQIDESGHCTSIEGLIFHTDIDGFRLPTEAEWIAAAAQDFNPKESWNSENSDYRAHTVCTKDKNKLGLCDMAGNVMEWVNDWLGNLKDTTLTNYVGAPDGGSIGERVVKGGSYMNAPSAMTLYGRGDTYSITSSDKADYVGFRLAFGKIPNAIWLGNNGAVTESRVSLIASAETVKEYTRTFSTKLAFRNDISGNLVYIDYKDGGTSAIEIPDTMEVYHPDISPDGSKVAFCTKLEGLSGKSTLYVRNLDETGSGLKKLNVESAAIPRWRITQNGDTVIVYVSDAGNNSDEKKWSGQSTWEVPFSEDAFGTPRKILDGTYHGGISDDNSIAVTGARLLRARTGKNIFSDGTDAIWYNGEQACNVSLVKDGTKRVAFLDFSGKTGKEFVGSSYSTHQRLLIADSTGKLIQSVGAPSGFTFDHSEWATDVINSNIVATLTNIDGAHTQITLVDPQNNKSTILVEGDELWHPNLWIKKKKNASSSSGVSASSSSAAPLSSSDSVSSSSAEISSSSAAPESSSSQVPVSSSSAAPLSSSESVSSSSEEISSSSATPESSSSEVPSSSSATPESSSSQVPASSSSAEPLSSSEEESSSSSAYSSSARSYGPLTATEIRNIAPTIQYELDEDSAGNYFINESQALQWRYSMELLWTYKDESNTVILGSSRPYNGTIPKNFSSPIHAVNLSCPKNTMYGTLFMTRNYVLPHVKNLKYLIISLDIDIFALKQAYSFFDTTPTGKGSAYPYNKIKGYVYDENHNFWKDGYPEDLLELTSDGKGSSLYSGNLQTRGYHGNAKNSSWTTTPTPEKDSLWRQKDPTNFDDDFDLLKELLQITANLGIYVIGVEYPQNPNFKNTGAYGKYGLTRSEMPEIFQLLENLSDQYEHFVFFNENNMGNHDYTQDMFYDNDHLCDKGAQHMTDRLDSLLKTLK